MKKNLVISIILSLTACLLTTAVFAASVFGPQQYIRTTGGADVFTDSFTADPGDGVLTISNGDPGGSNTVSSAIITLNGEVIFGPADFSTGVNLLESPVTLANTNTLEITLKKGKTGSYLTVGVTQGTGGSGGGGSDQPEFVRQYADQIPADATVDYDSTRFSLLTGLVEDSSGVPMMDVSVTLHGHPEYGTATTDSAGSFSLPLNGGGISTLVYQKTGLIPVQRKVSVGWNEIAVAETVRMIPYDTASTTVSFDGNPDTIVSHQSTVVSDTSGNRTFTMVFTGDNMAYEVDADGNVIGQLTSITTRATEFSTPESMPALLPPNSAYTYCAELSVDGAERVRFDKPVVTWVDNFLGFDVGSTVPVGYYDRDKAAWVPNDNGVVVVLLDTDSDGVVDALDADGDGNPDDLDNDGSFIDEVQGLDDPVRFAPGATFWRVLVSHFTPWDCNWPYGPPADAITPNPDGEPTIDEQKPDEDPCKEKTGSFVEHRSRIFHEDIPIPGTDVSLHYSSDRVEGYKTVVSVPASGDTVPASLQSIRVEMMVAGRTFTNTLDPLPNQKTEFVWDGLDTLGNSAPGGLLAKIKISFIYPAFYMTPSVLQQAFAQTGAGIVTSIRARQEIGLGEETVVKINRSFNSIAEGWTLSPHHYSQFQKFTLYKGDGSKLDHGMNFIDHFAGNGDDDSDGIPAIDAVLPSRMDMTGDAEGNIYLTDSSNHRIRKIDTTGIITTIAGGNQKSAYAGDGGPAISAKLAYPKDIESDGEGNLYFFDGSRIRKIDTQGIITTVAGNGNYGYSGDGGLAIEASLQAEHMALDSSGNIYTIDTISNNREMTYRIRKIDNGGIINTIYENYAGYNPNYFIEYSEIVVDDEGNIYFADYPNNLVRKIDQSGIITIVAGNGGKHHDLLGDGGPATQAPIGQIMEIALDALGNLYIACWDEYVTGSGGAIKKVDRNGIITTVAGTGTRNWSSGDGGLASQAEMEAPLSISFDPLGNLYTTDSDVIRKISYETSNFFSDKNGMGYIMSYGRHDKTIDLETGISLHEFGYDQDNNLLSISDQFSNIISIQRDSSSIPTSITSPDGLITHLTIDANNHLTRITYPNGSFYDFEYTLKGLLTAKIEPEANRFDHIFDANGRLTEALDEEGGHWQFTRTENEYNDIISQVITGEGNVTSYQDHTDLAGTYTSYIMGPNGAVTNYDKSSDGLSVNKSLSCTMDLSFKYDIDPEHKFKFLKEMTETTPSTLTRTTTRNHIYQDTDLDDIPDLITKTISVNGKSTSSENNVLQSKQTITSPEGRTGTILYDPNTLVFESVSVPNLFDTSYGYDSIGRLISVDTNTRGVDFTYNTQGFLATFTDAENHTTGYFYDAVGRVTRIDRPDTTSLWFTYDNNGNMTVLTNPSSIDHGFGFSNVNLNNSYYTPLSGSYSYIYDKDRRLVSKTFPSLKSINYIYDNARLSQVLTPEGNIAYTHYCGSKIASITKGSESMTYGYDGKLTTSEAFAGTLPQSLTYTYNNDFNVAGFSYAGDTESYSYDNDFLLTGAGGFTITRNAANGLPESVSGGALSLSRTFNGYGEADSHNYAVNGVGLTSWSLARNDAGRITEKTETVDGVTSTYVYSYDSVGRLLTITKDGSLAEEYRYTDNGNRSYETNIVWGIVGRTYSYSDEDHLLSAGPTTYQYDLDGFLTTRTEGADSTTYDYSSRGELLSVILPDGTVIENLHDPLGRRIAKKVNGVIVEKYLWQGLTRLLAVYDGSNNLQMRFEYADGRMPVAMTAGGTTYYLTYDQVGSLRVVADGSGSVVKKIDYDSFGNIITDSNQGFTVPFGFAGGLQDRDTGLVRFGLRDYDPDTGRWTSKDPIGFAGGDIDLYGYVENDPVNWVDPFGLEVLVCNRKVDGFPFFGNHAYPWDTTTNTAEGMRGSSGSGADSNEKGPGADGDSCNEVEGSKGKEQDIMDFMRQNQNNGMWIPLVNDCHNAVQDAVENTGLEYPGAPGGRFGEPRW